MTSDAGLVELTTAKTAFEAEWLVGALKGMDIHAVTFGDQLTDEFAMSQQMMGLGGGVRVMVPRTEIERARTALVEIEQNRPTSEELDIAYEAVGGGSEEEAVQDEASQKTAGGRTGILVLLSIAVIVLGVIALNQHEKLSAWERASPLTESTWYGDRWEMRWRANGELESIASDRDANGVYEEVWAYDPEGRILSKSYDQNQDGIWELLVETDPHGNERCRSIDDDENGVFERFEYPAIEGVQERWIDADEDRRWERHEFVDVHTGKTLDAFEDRGRQGFVRVK